MNISIDNETTSKIIQKTVKAQVEFCCRQLGLALSDLSIAYVHDERMTEVNEQYLQHEGTTDIITFDYTEEGSPLIEGELVICLDQAKRQAREYKVDLANELSRLLFHGLLHLAGFDDATDELRQVMSNKENELLAGWYQSSTSK